MSEMMELTELVQLKSWFVQKQLADITHPLKPYAETLLRVSDYACRQIELLRSLLINDECQTVWQRADYFHALTRLSPQLLPEQYQRELRQFRHTHFLRLLLLELAGRASTEEVMLSWSDCADALILHAMDYARRLLSVSYGVPRNEQGEEAQLVCLAMGKLGGRELNYSSDVDLIFAFTAEGYTDGQIRQTNGYYFNKVVQQWVSLIHALTRDGFVFRVDLRLRPNGDSGPLVSSLESMETYYQEQGRDWERYAMVKARVITADEGGAPAWYDQLILPFVYRRYVDFSVIESLRSMKAMIEREVQLNPRLDDIKRGQGGIREVEFIIQNFQLIRGGRLPALQKQNAMQALLALKETQLLPRSEVLKQAYLFLRQLENALQSLNDQQTHSLPEDHCKRAQITMAMGFSQWDELIEKLHQYQRIISHSFRSVLAKVDVYEDEKRVLANQLASLWHGHVEESMAINLLTSLGYDKAEHCYQMVHAFRQSPRCRRLPQGARLRLDRFMVMLLIELTHYVKTDEILLQVMQLLENIVNRSAYLALLSENPQALKEVLFWFANSPFITTLLVSQPFLLEVLLEQEPDWHPPTLHALTHLLAERLSHVEDIELQEDVLRQFKLTYWLMSARSESKGSCNAIRIGKFLSDLAQVIVRQVVAIACRQLSVRYPEIHRIAKQFAVVAYGKLGSREMNYTSDLDLVFLHQATQAEEGLVIRLTQRILHTLTTRSQVGVLYSVDTRLRPSGAAGLLVSPVDAFIDYQTNHAWTWEHQALLKARVLLGNSTIVRAFQRLKRTVLLIPRERLALQEEVLNMRAKIGMHQASEPIKHRRGGLLDLEFLVQFLVLQLGNEQFAQFTHTMSQLRQLFLAKALSLEQCLILKRAYKHYHQSLHQALLKPSVVSDEAIQQQVLGVCEAVYGAVSDHA